MGIKNRIKQNKAESLSEISMLGGVLLVVFSCPLMLFGIGVPVALVGIGLLGNTFFQAHRASKYGEAHQQETYFDQMTGLADESLTLFESAPRQLVVAEGHLDAADRDYADGAYGPFWDSVEQAAVALGRIDESVGKISTNLASYRELSTKYRGAAPAFPLAPVSINSLAASEQIASRLQATVRRAQCDFQFATIFEQRKTNRILVAGFSNLADALDRMSWQLTSSIANLSQSVTAMGAKLDESLGGIHSRVGDVAITVSRQGHESIQLATAAAERERRAVAMLEDIRRRQG